MTASTTNSAGASIRYGSTRSMPEPRRVRVATPGAVAAVTAECGRSRAGRPGVPESEVALLRQVVLDLGRGLVHRGPAAAARGEGDVELFADDRLDLRPVGCARSGLRSGVELGERDRQKTMVLDGLGVLEGRRLDGQVARASEGRLRLRRREPLHERDRVVLVRRGRADAVDEDPDLRDRLLLLRNDREVELADDLRLRRIV